MAAAPIGYARCSTDKQGLEANRQILLDVGASTDQIYVALAYPDRPVPDQALARVRAGDTLVAPKLDRRTQLSSCTPPAGTAPPN